MRTLLTAVFGACAITGASNAQIYVDPVLGNDSNPATVGAPVRTITQAVALLGAAPSQPIYLAPGRYVAANGEAFPITVPASYPAFSLIGLSPEGATIVTPGGATGARTAFQTSCDIVALRDIDIEAHDAGIEATLSNSPLSQLILQNVDIRGAATGLRVTGSVRVDLQRCTITAAEQCIQLQARVGGAFSRLESCRLAAAAVGIEHDSVGGASTALLCSGTTFHQHRSGFEAVGAGTVTASFENCTFYRNGIALLPVSASDGAIVRGTSTDPISVNNCLFAETLGSSDFVGYTPATDTVTNCIVTQANLVGVGGSFQAAVSFVDGPGGDLHLTAPSAAIDAGGAPNFATADIDGYPFALDCAAAAADIGADEYVHDFVYIANELTLGSIAKVRMHADSGELFLAVWSLPMGSPPSALCGAPYIPSASTFLTSTTSGSGAGVSTVGVNGVGELLSPLPSSAALAGVTLWFQGVAVQVGGAMQISRNVHVGTFEL